MPKIQPVILCGGAGTRLFPISRAQWPKQFLALTSTRSLLQETARRVAPSHFFSAPVVVANADHRFAVAQHMRDIGIAPAGLLLEPHGRNTAAAIAAAAHFVLEQSGDPETLLLVLPSDHAITDQAAFERAVELGARAVQGTNRLATFGIEPTRPDTGFGYIACGAELANAPHVFQVGQFREKPDLAAAQAYIEAGGHVWNSGMFLFSIRTILSEMDQYAPEIAAGAKLAVDGALRDLDFIRLEPQSFNAVPSISIDYAVMEKTKHAVVIPCSIGWSDVGSFKALWEVAQKDENGNAVHGDVTLLNSTNSLFHAAGNAMIAGIGVSDMTVIATDDVILVAHRDQTESVKTLVAELTARGRKEPALHRLVHRPWGSYELISTAATYQVKRIVVNKGAGISLQKHFRRAEHWVIVEGRALVHRDGSEMELGPNESTYIPIGAVHRLTNIGDTPLVLIEVQSGDYLGEDDIVRLEDSYHRDAWDRQ
jgi:mannose-1-phosphate guanylyltransferase/mannose-6-phosphate isomerase